MTLSLKMGIDEVFKETLSNQLFQASQYPGYSGREGVSMNLTGFRNNYGIMPKFLKNSSSNINCAEFISKIQSKKSILNKMLSTYFQEQTSKDNQDIKNELGDIENRMMLQERGIKEGNAMDYQSFQEMILLINSLKKESDANINQISLNDYQNMSTAGKQSLLEHIKKNKYEIILNLGLTQKDFSSDYEIISKPPEPKQSLSKIKGEIQGVIPNLEEKYQLFRMITGNQNLPDAHIKIYLNGYTPNVQQAAERYFQNSYQSPQLTLIYSYENIPNFPGKKEIAHHFSFVAKIDELFNQVISDHPRFTLGRFNLIASNGTEISLKNKKVKCIGALHLLNKSTVKIKLI